MTYKLYFTEYHQDIEFWKKEGYKLLAVDPDGWGEFEHVEEFNSASDSFAKDEVYALGEMSYNSSGVFSVFNGNKLAFTEEDCNDN
jgi:hypothetical protein